MAVDDDPPWVFWRICYLCVSDLVPPWLTDQALSLNSLRRTMTAINAPRDKWVTNCFLFHFVRNETWMRSWKKKTVDTNLIFFFILSRYNAVWLIFFIMGLATLLPWNFFMTATMVSFLMLQANWVWEYLQLKAVNPWAKTRQEDGDRGAQLVAF